MEKNIIKVGVKEYQLFEIIDKEKDIVSFKVEREDGSVEKVGEIISKNGIKKLRDKFNLKVSFLFYDKETHQTILTKMPIPQEIELSANNKFIYVFAQIKGEGDETAIEVGEINAKNISGISAKYPIAMLYKRAYGRGILEFLRLYEFYTEEEAKEFQEKFQEKEQEESKTEAIEMINCKNCGKELVGEEALRAKRRIADFGVPYCDKCLVEKFAPKRGAKKEEKDVSGKKSD